MSAVRWVFLAAWSLPGCASGQPAAATRVLAPGGRDLAATPVCFVPPPASADLTTQAQQIEVLGLCEQAARAEGVTVVGHGSPGCLAASLTWGVQDTDRRKATCTGTYLTGWLGQGECFTHGEHLKTVKVTLQSTSSNAVLAETTATIRSSTSTFKTQSFEVLCRAAFHDYPQPLVRASFDVPN